MERQIIATSDGSTTIHMPEWNESYHSKHGAIQEAYHVFIKNGLSLFEDNSALSILEIGFGTGLNTFITCLEAEKRNLKVHYEGVEAYPISEAEILQMNYVSELSPAKEFIFNAMHQCNWDEEVQIENHFLLKKRKHFFEAITDTNQFDLIYFDAFGYRVQPELWSALIFEKMYNALKNNGILVTYAARGIIKRNMMEAGFSVEKLAGPPGKREMFRATKNLDASI